MTVEDLYNLSDRLRLLLLEDKIDCLDDLALLVLSQTERIISRAEDEGTKMPTEALLDNRLWTDAIMPINSRLAAQLDSIVSGSYRFPSF